MKKIGPVERKIYELRQEHPFVIPQVDPDKFNSDTVTELFSDIREMGINHIAVGGTILDMTSFQKIVDIAVKDFDFTLVTYMTNTAIGLLQGYSKKTAVYWMTVLNSENPFYLRDSLIMCSIAVSLHDFEPLPTAYVFDDRGSFMAANWLARVVPVPREEQSISLSIALAAEFSGSRFYIMAGGSESKLHPPADHVRLLTKETDLFVIPTSGIRTLKHAEEMFEAGADAIHVGRLIEDKKGLDILSKIVKSSKKYPGKEFL
ncbi:MAG: hypothetical protein JW778_00915 [Candidatus Altiarchaeota archaeon]|nr:hypothetical protein [Candidatus Altiarchaeota archaeon]